MKKGEHVNPLRRAYWWRLVHKSPWWHKAILLAAVAVLFIVGAAVAAEPITLARLAERLVEVLAEGLGVRAIED